MTTWSEATQKEQQEKEEKRKAMSQFRKPCNGSNTCIDRFFVLVIYRRLDRGGMIIETWSI
jgi:hypothetical protein